VRAVVLKGVSPAAASEIQRGSRTAHVTVKAHVRPTGKFRRFPWSGPLGVREAARTHGLVETRLARLVSKDRSNKPVVQLSRGKRESDGS